MSAPDPGVAADAIRTLHFLTERLYAITATGSGTVAGTDPQRPPTLPDLANARRAVAEIARDHQGAAMVLSNFTAVGWGYFYAVLPRATQIEWLADALNAAKTANNDHEQLVHSSYLAATQLSIGDVDGAFNTASEGVLLADRTDNKSTQAAFRNTLGEIALHRDDPTSAVRHFHTAIDLLNAGAGGTSATVWSGLARAQERQGDPVAALESHDRALIAARGEGDLAQASIIQSNRLQALVRAGQIGAAREANRDALDLARKAKSAYAEALALSLHHVNARELGDEPPNIGDFRHALALARRTGDRALTRQLSAILKQGMQSLVADALASGDVATAADREIEIADLALGDGDTDAAMRLAEGIVAKGATLQDRETEALGRLLEGRCFGDLNRHEQAIDRLSIAKALLETDLSTAGSMDRARLLGHLRHVFMLLSVGTRHLGRPLESYEYAVSSLAAAAECTDDPEFRARASGQAGLALTDAGKAQEALHWFERADSLFGDAGLTAEAAYCRFNRARAEHRLGHTASAKATAREVLELLRQLGDAQTTAIETEIADWPE